MKRSQVKRAKKAMRKAQQETSNNIVMGYVNDIIALDINPHIAITKYSDYYTLRAHVFKVLDLLSRSNRFANTEYGRQTAQQIALLSEDDHMFTITPAEVFRTLVEGGDLTAFLASYRQIMTSRLIDFAMRQYNTLHEYSALIESGKLHPINILNMDVLKWAPFVFSDFDLKKLIYDLQPRYHNNFEDIDKDTFARLYISITKHLFDDSKKLYNLLTTADIDTSVLVKMIDDTIEKIKQLPKVRQRYNNAFRYIQRKTHLLQSNLYLYYRQFVKTGDNKTIFTCFLEDVMSESDDTVIERNEMQGLVTVLSGEYKDTIMSKLPPNLQKHMNTFLKQMDVASEMQRKTNNRREQPDTSEPADKPADESTAEPTADSSNIESSTTDSPELPESPEGSRCD